MGAAKLSERLGKVTVKEVAEAAGVSTASVSRVVNEHDNVAASTREAVLEAITRLNYMPHNAGRVLATRRSRLIGVILPDIYGEYFSELVRGIDQAAREHGLHLLVAGSHGDAAEARGLIREMHGRVDGLILMSPYLESTELMAAVSRDMRTVLLNSAGESRIDSFAIDNFAAARMAARHLIAAGRRKIAHIAGPAGNIEAGQRRAGYEAALAEAGDLRPIILQGDFTDAAGAEAGRTIAAHTEDFDAVFAANDMMALGCLAALAEVGVKVPDDVAIVGFDDIPLARFVNPALTTVGVDIAGLGRKALEKVAARIDGDDAAFEDITIHTRLVVRRSCGAARQEPGDS